MFGTSKLTEKNIIEIIGHIKQKKWNRNGDQPCIYTFYSKYYINICAWNNCGTNTVTIDVDDIKSGRNNVVYLDVFEGESDYDFLINLFSSIVNFISEHKFDNVESIIG